MGFVFSVNFITKIFSGRIENYGDIGGTKISQQFIQHIAKAIDGIHMRAVRGARFEPDRVIGTEDVAGTINQEHVVALLEWARCVCGDRCGRGDF